MHWWEVLKEIGCQYCTDALLYYTIQAFKLLNSWDFMQEVKQKKCNHLFKIDLQLSSLSNGVVEAHATNE